MLFLSNKNYGQLKKSVYSITDEIIPTANI